MSKLRKDILFQRPDAREIEVGMRQYKEGSEASAPFQMMLYPSDRRKMQTFISHFKQKTGRTLSMTYLLRGGYPLFIRMLGNMLRKAERGELHAKKREEYTRTNTSRSGHKKQKSR